jgi:hypothetical protein
MGDKIAPQRNAQGRVIGTGRTAVEESAAEKKRKTTAAWNAKYFQHLGVGSGIGGAAAIDKYKTANPGWEKKRDTWAQGVAAAAKAKKPKPKFGATLGELAEKK